MQIRAANRDDFSEIDRIWAFCFNGGEPNSGTWDDAITDADVFVAEDANLIVGAYRHIRLHMHRGDTVVPICGIGDVGVPLASRGKGIAQEMMRHAVLRSMELGQVGLVLYGFSLEWYRSVGYETVGTSLRFDLDVKTLIPYPETVNVHAVDPSDRSEIEGVYTEWCRRYRGPIRRTASLWKEKTDAKSENKPFAYVYTGVQGPEGYLIFQLGEHAWHSPGPHGEGHLDIREFIALTPEAHRGLIGMLARLDMQYKRIKWTGTTDSWVFTEPRLTGLTINVSSQPMARSGDLERALSVPSPSVSGEYTVRVDDEDWAGGSKTFFVTLESGAARVFPSDATPGLQMSQKDFIRAWFGDPDARALRRGGRISVYDEEQFEAFCSHFTPGVFFINDYF